MKSLLLILAAMLLLFSGGAFAADGHSGEPAFLAEMAKFPAEEQARGLDGIGERLSFRARQQPFLLVATIIFILAIVHTFFAIPITKFSHKVQHAHDTKIRRLQTARGEPADADDMVSFKATMLHFLGEVEAIFGIWVLVLLAAMFAFHDLTTVKGYMMGVNFTEPLFVVIIMAFASTRPILRFAESCLRFFARFGKQTPAA